MFGQNVNKLIIVCDESTQEYANYLRQLVSSKDDEENEIVGTKDGSVDAVVWFERDYVANMATISSSEHVLFIGENKVSKTEISSMNVKFDKYGLKYGWLGKRGMMLVSEMIDTEEKYKDFLEFCSGYEKEFEEVVFKKDLSEKPIKAVSKVVKNNPKALIAAGALLGFVTPTLTLVTGAVVGVSKLFSGPNKKELKDQQYKALTAILYMDGLTEFLEG